MTKLLSVKELAKYLNLTQRTVYNLIDRGEIPFLKVGGQYRFKEEEIARWLSKRADRKAGLDLKRVKSERDPLTKRLIFMALLTKALETENLKPVVVGGNAVEFYTAGGYATADIDVVVPSQPLDPILRSWGFQKEGRHWFSEDLDIVIEAPASFLDPEQLKRIFEVEIDGLIAYVLGIEDLLVDRLNAFVHLNSTDDGGWAKALMTLHFSEIDWDYLEKRAEEERVKTALAKLKKEVIDHAKG